ncbi:hypothetical protein GLYMA_03G135600v4 [Glycine max]|uniref:Uncharacterized protein n=2 Tax=Glycine subgen. Soja TaxID=1462606 RepID=K7KEU9_SOYBN|nr:hypothetical protein JHK87_007244 [Glycine soja]KAG5055114.1 hypothetical protein JHK85_007624 [Glycine max]KAG5072193.1 hypothetical protein JHK86_007404 [Glycine max]KAH1069849.1 hypothetical protein GYH30_007141 [Glycine max]KHN07361.1 hypothetical protein glysoja_012659 [Glycine soja]
MSYLSPHNELNWVKPSVLSTFIASSDSHCFHVNCGGKNVKVMENDENIHYVGDGDMLGSGAAKYFIHSILLG